MTSICPPSDSPPDKDTHKKYRCYYKHLLDGKDIHNKINKERLIEVIVSHGILIDDKRFNGIFNNNTIDQLIDFESFIKMIDGNHIIFDKIFTNDLIIQNWTEFTTRINAIYHTVKEQDSIGSVATYIPQLAHVNPDLFAVSICSIDGQMYNCGDYKHEFCIQSCSKPITYIIASDIHGSEYVHNFIGREPSGRNFNELCMNSDNIPHNPLINSGAIMCASLVDYNQTPANRYDTTIGYWSKLAGNTKINFSTSVYLSEKQTADRNNCLAYMMQECNAFSTGMDEKYRRDWDNNNLYETLDFYFQCCSIEIDCAQAAIIAGTLANGGICPVTNERVVSNKVIQNVLSLMSSCGMYDFSGEWAYQIGLPAKSGVSGIIMCIIPGVMGIATFSPRLDKLGNSHRGIDFFKELSSIYSFHIYNNKVNKTDRILQKHITQEDFNIYNLLKAAQMGDLYTMILLYSKGVDLNSTDYDNRCALHLACSENHLHLVNFILNSDSNINCTIVDRWNNTPMDDILRYQKKIDSDNNIELNKCIQIIELLTDHIQ
jgi:glutaminase